MMNVKKILVACGVLAVSVTASALDEDTKAKISQQISGEIGNHLYQEYKQKEVKHHERKERLEQAATRDKDSIYWLPNLPYYSVFFRNNDLIQLIFKADFASQAYSGRGRVEGLPQLVFGEPTIRVQDVLLSSKLIKNNLLNATALGGLTQQQANALDYRSILANQDLIFDADLNRYTASIDYSRHFWNGGLTVGLHVPIMIKNQRLRLVNSFSSDILKQLADAAANANVSVASEFPFTQYPTLEAFLTDVLAQRGIALNKDETTIGFSDINLYAYGEIHSKYVNTCIVGLNLILPTARFRNVGKLWDADMGNGKFVQVALFGSGLWDVNRWFNPYVHVKATYGFADVFDRRVPMTNTFVANGANSTFNGNNTGNAKAPAEGYIPFSDGLKFAAQPFAQLDSTPRNFSQQAISVKVAPGPEFFLRLGTTAKSVFTCKGFFDITYDFNVRGADHVVGRAQDEIFNTRILEHNSWNTSHTLMANYFYQFDADYRARAGAYYVVAGQNAVKSAGFELALNIEF